ncbi:S49 family peptidase [bacterium]|nr:S49 family peptidase [bacterium]
MLPSDDKWLIDPAAMERYAAAIAAADLAVLSRQGFTEPKGRTEGATALVHISGPLTKNPTLFTMLFNASTYAGVSEAIQRAADNPAVDRIVLLIDSPGGTVDGVQETGKLIAEVNRKKPVVAVVDGVAASAAYWLASQAGQIYATGTLSAVGSIGVRMTLFDVSKQLAKEGVRPVIIDTGNKKSVGAFGRAITDADREYIQNRINVVFDEFQSVVATGRKMPLSRLKPLADGGMFYAGEALQNGLIDGVKSLREVLASRSLASPATRSTARPATQPAVKTGPTPAELAAKFEKAWQLNKSRGMSPTKAISRAATNYPEGHKAWLASQQPKGNR